MLLSPEDGEPFRDPRMDRSQAMQPGVAAGADGNQEPRLAHARLAMMDVEFSAPCPTALAPVSVALKHAFPVSGEVIPRVPAHPVALRAETADRRDPLPAGAKERLLPKLPLGASPQEAFRSAGEG